MTELERPTFFAATDVGRKRSHNEDNFLVDESLGLFIVADGMGGHAAGEVASAIAVRTIHEVVAQQRDMIENRRDNGPHSTVSTSDVLKVLEFAVQSASTHIHNAAQSDSDKRGMGTTVSLLLLIGSHGYVAHVGDSRIYLARGGQTHQVTDDHTVANELLRLGLVNADQVDRIPRHSAITRAVGVYEHVEVDTLTLEILPSDQFVLCSDGLSGYLDDTGDDVMEFLADEDGEEVVQGLVDYANAHGGKDNVTAVLVRLPPSDNLIDSTRAERLALKREVLRAMPLFSRLNSRELLRVMQVAEVYEFEAGETVMHEGDPGDRMFVMLSGKITVSRGDTKLRELGPADHVGEMSLIRSTPRSATVTAINPSELISIARSDFFEIIRSEPRIAVKLLWQFLGVFADRLEQTSNELVTARGETRVGDGDDPFAPSVRELDLEPLISLRTQVAPPEQSPDPPPAKETPSFADAPQMAHKVDEAPVVAESGPATRAHDGSKLPGSVSAPISAPDDVPATARTTDANTASAEAKSRAMEQRINERMKHFARLDAEAARTDEPAASFNGKKTLVKARKQKARNRSATLTSAGMASARSAERTRVNIEIEQEPAAGDAAPTTSARGDGTLPLTNAREPAASANEPPADEHRKGERGTDEHRHSSSNQRKHRKSRNKRRKAPRFQPVDATVPIDRDGSLPSELEGLRNEFKKRLKKAREDKDDRGDG